MFFRSGTTSDRSMVSRSGGTPSTGWVYFAVRVREPRRPGSMPPAMDR